jgi:hypothetical protein
VVILASRRSMRRVVSKELVSGQVCFQANVLAIVAPRLTPVMDPLAVKHSRGVAMYCPEQEATDYMILLG